MFDKQETGQSVSNIIVKAAVKGKFLDFRNGLVPAKADEYAMIHGIGGKNHAPRSGIKCLITDYGMHDAVTVSANMSPEMFPYMMTVCEKNISVGCNMVSQVTNQPTTETKITKQLEPLMQQPLPRELTPQQYGELSFAIPAPLLTELQTLQNNPFAMNIISSLTNIQALPDNGSGIVYMPVKESVLKAFIQNLSSYMPTQTHTNNGGTDFSYKQDRVNIYKNENGLCPVNVITISRTGLRPNGEISRLPWSIKIQNFLAPPIQQANGTTAYNARNIQNKKEAFVTISDLEMYRCCYRVSRFIELWEMAYGIPLIKNGIAVKDQIWKTKNQNN